MEDQDGLIGMDVFSRFLVTLDYPMRKLGLSPLPPRPGDAASPSSSLKTSEDDADGKITRLDAYWDNTVLNSIQASAV